MQGIVPRLRLAGLALPFLTAGCMSGILPGPEADNSCLLLCALTRAITGEPTPPAPAPVATPAKPPAPRTVPRPRGVAVAKPPRLVAAPVHPRPHRRKPVAQVSVVPQAPAHAPEARPVAIVPPAPAPVAVAPPPPTPVEPPRTLTQVIPGAVGIMAPALQGQ